MFIHLLRKHIHWLRWAVPLTLATIVVLYELGPAHWVHEKLGMQYHIFAEILFFGTIGPFLAFMLLYFVSRWLEERETSELQSQVLEQAREQVNLSLGLSDHAIQSLFAASVLLGSFRQTTPELPSETARALDETEQALKGIVVQLRGQLQNQSLI